MNIEILAQNLELLVGQDQAKHLLKQCLIQGSRNAYLLVGPPGVGKGCLARIIAASFHDETGVTKIHPDILVFEDILRKNAGEGEENRWKASVDDFIRFVYLSPVKSRVKVGIIEDIDRFSPGALNALLKTLEEPPLDAILILTAQETAHILPTILSRVQIVRLHYLMDTEIKQYLDKQGAARAEEITWLANGAVGRANQLISDEKLLATALADVDKFNFVIKKDLGLVLQAVNLRDREEAIQLLHTWLNLSRRILLYRWMGTPLPAQLESGASQKTELELIRLVDQLKSALSAVEANANVRIALEATVLSVM
ncbi:MAG: AAA family ATPase [Patescibacteria group bacterium]